MEPWLKISEDGRHTYVARWLRKTIWIVGFLLFPMTIWSIVQQWWGGFPVLVVSLICLTFPIGWANDKGKMSFRSYWNDVYLESKT